MLGAAACVSLLVGCAQPVGDDTEESSGAMSRPPGAEADKVEADRVLSLKRAVVALYRAIDDERLEERKDIRCAGDAAGTRTFSIRIDYRGLGTTAAKAMGQVEDQLDAARYGRYELIVVESPTSDAKRKNISFAGVRDKQYCSNVIVSCKGVESGKPPTDAQCGLTQR